jgi:hypothetical protein
MAVTHKLIQTVTVGAGGASSIDFTSIPQTYKDLILYASLRCDADTLVNQVRFNGLTTNLTTKAFQSHSTTVNGFTDAAAIKMYGGMNASSYTASAFASTVLYIPNYAGSKNKIINADSTSEANIADIYNSVVAGLWSSTAAITQVTFYPASGNYTQYSSASLYGISNS